MHHRLGTASRNSLGRRSDGHRRCFDSGMRVTAPPGEAKEGRREAHKNIISYSTRENGFIGIHGGSLGRGYAWQHAPLSPLQGWFRTPQDSRAGRWWNLTMPMTDAKMLELNRLRLLR
eukprot:5259462-Prymnesium_polylepis.1